MMHMALGNTAVPRTVVSDGQVTREDVTCPPLLPDYQTYMRGVDRADQLMGYYSVVRRSKKWWKRVFSYLIEVAALNGYIMYKAGLPCSQHRSFDYLKYRVNLAEELIGTFSSRPAMGRSRNHDNLQALRLDLSKSHLPEMESNPRLCVVYCTVWEARQLQRSEMRHETKVMCSICGVHLCLTSSKNCFKKYHTLVNYWL